MLQTRGKRSNNGMRDSEMDIFGFGGFGGRMMEKFSMGFGDDFFNMDKFYDPSEEIQNFSKLHKKAHNSKSDGVFYCETFVQSSKMGNDGKTVTEKYYDRNYGQHKGGNTISEKQQAYQNSQGQRKLAQQRMLNQKGRKVIKNKLPNGQIEETNHYYNIDPEEDFDSQWNNINRQIGFMENFNRLGYGQRRNVQQMMQLQYEPRNYDNNKNKERSFNRTNDKYNNNSKGMNNSEMGNSKRLNDQKPRQIDFDRREYGKSSNKYNNKTQTKNYDQTKNSKYNNDSHYDQSSSRNLKGGESKYGKSSSTMKYQNNDGDMYSSKGSKYKELDSFKKGGYRR